MITFDTSFTGIGIDVTGAVDEVPINSYLRTVHIDRYGVTVMDTSGQWGLIKYQDTTFDSNIALFNYLYSFTLIIQSQTKKIEICNTDLKTSFSAPIELIDNPGIGLLIFPHSFSYVYKELDPTVPYNFANDLYIHCSTKTDSNAFFQIIGATINGAVDYSSLCPIITGALQFVENDSLVLKAKTSDATQGEGRLTIYINYSIVEESWYDGVYCV